MLDQDRILQFIRTGGPTTPSKVAKMINTDSLLASAHLSDLSSQKKVKVSNLKIGGTPLYYIPGQEERLYNFANGNINPKDFEVLEFLKEKKLLREQELELLPRVALRGLKDFAVPFNVTMHGETELFWKFYLVSDEERDQLVRQMLMPVAKELPAAKEVGVVQQSDSMLMQEQYERVSAQTKLVAEELVRAEATTEVKREVQEREQEKVVQKVKEKPRRKKVIEDTFSEDLETFFKRLKIIIEQKETLRKNAEMNYFVKVPSVVGQMRYFCKAKNKAKCDERDLSAAYMEAQMKKLPLLFLYTDEMNKKAQEMMESGAFENVVVRKVE